MTIAYLIAAHTDPKHLERLIGTLTEENTHFYLHIDKKSDINLFRNVLKNPNVTLCKERIFTTWGGFSQCKYQIALIDELLNSGKEFDKVFFISGQDYPILSNNDIKKYLKRDINKEHIMGVSLSGTPSHPQAHRINQYHFFRDLKSPYLIRRVLIRASRDFMKLFPKRRPYLKYKTQKYDVYWGSSWWCLSWECIKYVREKLKEKEIIQYFKRTYAPDELMIQTIVFNSPFKKHAIEVSPQVNSLPECTPLHFIEYPKEGIRIPDEKDFPRLIKSGKLFFRKAKTGFSDQLLDTIDKHRL